METILLAVLIAIAAVTLVIAVISLAKSGRNNISQGEIISAVNDENRKELSQLRQELTASTQQSVKAMGDMISENQSRFSRAMESRLQTFSLENEQKLDLIRKSVETKLS